MYFAVVTCVFAAFLKGDVGLKLIALLICNGGGILCQCLSGGVPLGHLNPYPVLDHDQLDFATLF